jgi:hypothetical protein
VANIIRDIIPLAYSVIQQNLSDAIEYKRGDAAYVVTTATPVPTLGDEPIKAGNVMKFFMSQAQVGVTPPARGDLLKFGGVEYLVNQVDSNDYDGYNLVVIKK